MQATRFIHIPTLVLALSLTPACSNGQSTPDAANKTEAVAISDASLRKGKILFLQCQACHALKADEGNRVGPNLSGLFGRDAGAAEGFGYSDAMKDSGIVWNREQLNEFITNPTTKVSGTIMAFGGVADAANRTAIIDYLQVETRR